MCFRSFNCADNSLIRRSCAFTFCCKAESDWLATETCGTFSGTGHGGLATHPQLTATQAITPGLTLDNGLFTPYFPPYTRALMFFSHSMISDSAVHKEVRTRPVNQMSENLPTPPCGEQVFNFDLRKRLRKKVSLRIFTSQRLENSYMLRGLNSFRNDFAA